MKKMFLIMLLPVVSCSEKDPDIQPLLKIVANTSGVDDVRSMKTFIINVDTRERQWVQLTQNGTATDLWEKELSIGNGNYRLETLLETIGGEPAVKIAYVVEMQLNINKRVSASFNGFRENGPFRLHDFAHHTLLTSVDPCNFSYKVYIGSELCNAYVYVDRFWWRGASIIGYSYKEFMVDKNETCADPDQGIERLEDTGVIVTTLPSMEAAACASATVNAQVIDGTITVGGTLMNGERLEDAHDFVNYKP